MKVLVMLALVAAVAVLAGCGSTTGSVGVAKTRVVQAKPCATEVAMTECAVKLLQSSVKRAGLPPDLVAGRCSLAGVVWSCTMQVPVTTSRLACARAVVDQTGGAGAPAIASVALVPFSRCDAVLGAV